MSELLKVILSDKGRDANRTLIFAGVLFCGWHIMEIKENVADLRTQMAVLKASVPARAAWEPVGAIPFPPIDTTNAPGQEARFYVGGGQ